MKFSIVAIAAALFMGLTTSATCNHDLEVLCIDDINKGYAICDKAAKEQGKDVPADLQCVKYFAAVEKDCWPCICVVAQQNNWPLKGCN